MLQKLIMSPKYVMIKLISNQQTENYGLQANENVQQIQCSLKCGQFSQIINIEPDIDHCKRFYCRKCAKNITNNHFKNLNEILSEMEMLLHQNMPTLTQIITPHINLIDDIQQKLRDAQNKINIQITSFITDCELWKQSILKQITQYDFKDKLEKYIMGKNLSVDIICILQNLNTLIYNNEFKINLQKINLSVEIKETQQIFKSLYDLIQNQKSQQLSFINPIIEPNYIPYKLLPNLIKQEKIQDCQAMAINYYNNLLVISTRCKIKIYQIHLIQYQPQVRASELKEIQTISGLGNYVNTLKFFLKRQSMRSTFISGQDDGLIIIWSPSLRNLETQRPMNWILQQKLEAKSWVYCIALHPVLENILVSGTFSGAIKFWSFERNNFQQFQEITHQKRVTALTFNFEGKILLSCSEDKYIFVMKKVQKYQWEIKQKILLELEGSKLAFISNNQFSFLPYNSQILYLYSINSSQKLFQEVQVDGRGDRKVFFPQVYIPQLNFLITINELNVNIIQLKLTSSEQLNFEKKQSITFERQSILFKSKQQKQDFDIAGAVSCNGALIIIWDEITMNFQIREYNQNHDQY